MPINNYDWEFPTKEAAYQAGVKDGADAERERVFEKLEAYHGSYIDRRLFTSKFWKSIKGEDDE